MALFVEIQVAPELTQDADAVGKLIEACPVDIFSKTHDGTLEIVDANVDECTLCELCLAVGKPGQVKVLKLYDAGAALQRSN